jgi:hypothetical protein
MLLWCGHVFCVILIIPFLYSDNKLDVAVQVSNLENGSWETDRKFVVELDGARKASRHQRVSSSA